MEKIIIGVKVLLVFLLASSCSDRLTDFEIDESLSPVDEVSLIPGTDKTKIVVNRSQEAYFSIEFSGIEFNNVIDNGVGEGWCINWQVPINSNGGVYEDTPLYSTYNKEKWKPISYLFNILDQLKQNDPGITFREVQIVIWSLRGYPEFDLETLDLQDLPSIMHDNGQPKFSREKVNDILQVIEDGYRDFIPSEGSKFAVIVETPADVQTIITIVE